MSLDFFAVLACCVFGLVSHATRHQKWLEWILRAIIALCFGGEALAALGWAATQSNKPWGLYVLVAMCLATGLVLFLPVRKCFSYVLSVLQNLVSGHILLAALRKANVLANCLSVRVFVPGSMPHLVALWIYITCVGVLLGSMDPASLKMPSLPFPVPVPLSELFMYNGLGLVLLAFCGVGIFVARKPVEVMKRLGLVRPSLPQVGIGLALIFVSFAYDAAWAFFTHQMGGDLASKLAGYNAGTFNAGGGVGPSVILALLTGLCAGIGEETLMRGAVQPALGIVPAALLHGLLHGQFAHAPIFIVQVAGWSLLLGIVRHYTNTSTTIIGHAGFNFITAFMFAFNP